jgi:hypothetical protein
VSCSGSDTNLALLIYLAFANAHVNRDGSLLGSGYCTGSPTVHGARYDIISMLGKHVTLVTSRFVDTSQVWAFTSARADSLAVVWLDTGITPCCKSAANFPLKEETSADRQLI